MRLLGQLGITFLATLLLAEIGARIFLPPPGLQPFPPNQPAQLLIKHPDRSYAYRPGFSGTVHDAPHTVAVAINERGMRDDPVSPGEPIDVLAVGDSFTAGYMVNADQAWPERLEHYLSTSGTSPRAARVLNGGVSGYSLKQIRLAAQDYSNLQPDVVVAGVLPAVADRLVNPYEWYEGYAVRAQQIPFLRKVDDGFLAALPDSSLSPATQFWLMQNFRIAASIWLAAATWQSSGSSGAVYAEANVDNLLPLLLDELGALDQFTRSNSQQLVVLLIGFQQPDGSFSDTVKMQNKKIMDFCAERNIPAFDPVPLFEANSSEPVFRIDAIDYHWTPLAHDIAAAGLANYMASLGNKD
jgi:hypothetical protein